MKYILVVVFVSLSLWAQVPAVPDPTTGVPMQGRIAPQGNFPLLNGGSVTMPADEDYTLVYPQFTGSVLRITSAVPLTATRNVIHNLPANPNQRFGFEFTVQNATSGGRDIVFKASTGAGVTIPNGQTLVVMFDGTNYVSVGAPSAGPGGGGEPSGPAGGDLAGSFPNPTVTGLGGKPLPVGSQTGFLSWNGANWHFTEGGDGITANVKTFGVKADGYVIACNPLQGNTRMYCYDSPNISPPVNAQFTSQDIGKLIIVYQAGPPTGQLRRDDLIYVESGGTGGKDGWQPVFWDDPGDGCNTPDTMPYAYVKVNNGKPQGRAWIPVFYGVGCIRAPTTGRVGTVEGEVHFTGGSIQAGDLPTRITNVIDRNEIEIADPIIHTQLGSLAMYGSDDHDSWESACNTFNSGHLTFPKGISMVSHGINCSNARFQLTGDSYGTIGLHSTGSTLVYAGKGRNDTTNAYGRDHLLMIHAGWGVKLERLGFRGNTMAMPFLVVASVGRSRDSLWHGAIPDDWNLSGNGMTQMNVYDQIWWGWAWGDDPGTNDNHSYQISSCLFADAETLGNVDFASIDHAYCFGSEVGFDANNAQATSYKFGKLHSQYNNIGTSVFGTQWYEDYYTEYNRLDISMGSPRYPGGYGVNLWMNFGGEASTKAFEYAPWQNFGNVYVDARGSGVPLREEVNEGTNWFTDNNPYINPWGTWIDISRISSGVTFQWYGSLFYQGKLKARNQCGNSGTTVDLAGGIRYYQIDWGDSYVVPGCRGLSAGKFRLHDMGIGGEDTELDTRFPGDSFPTATLLKNDNFYQETTGAIRVRSPLPPGQTGLSDQAAYINAFHGGSSGSITYHYQVTCSDGAGLETAPFNVQPNPTGMLTIPDSTATLNETDYNGVSFYRKNGCVWYHLYGDEGSGDIGHLSTVDEYHLTTWEYYGYGQLGFKDVGAFTKTGRKPPPISHSGAVDAERFKVNGQLLASTHLSDFAATLPQDGQVPVFSATTGKYTPGTVSASGPGGIHTINGNGNIDQHITGQGVVHATSGNGTTTIGLTANSPGLIAATGSGGGGGNAQYGHTAVGAGQSNVDHSTMIFVGFTPSTDGQIEDCRLYVYAMYGAQRAFCGLYASDGPGGAPHTLLCSDTTGTAITAPGWATLNPPSGCPTLNAGIKYYLASFGDADYLATAYDSDAPAGSAYFLSRGYVGFPSPADNVGSTSNVYSFYATVVAGALPTYSVGLLNPTSGYLHWTGTSFAWDTPQGGGGAVVTGTVTDIAPFEFGGGHLAKSGRLVNLTGHISLQTSMPQNTPMAQIPVNFRPSTDPTNPNYFGGIFDSGGNFLGFGLWNITSTGQITWRGSTVTPASGQVMVITAAWLQEE